MKEPTNLEELLRRPEISYKNICSFSPPPNDITTDTAEQVEISVKYQGYIVHQNKEIDKLKKVEQIKIPDKLDYYKVPSLTTEIREKLTRINPKSLGQASRISGVTPVAVSILMIYLKGKGARYQYGNRKKESSVY